MGDSPSTCWTLIEGARRGDEACRADFAGRYLPAVRAYLAARWRGTPLSSWVDDATQETFFDFFRADGALSRVDPTRAGGFRAFLYGVVRHSALHVETRWRRAQAREAKRGGALEAFAGREAEVEEAFDRAWAVALVREALTLQRRKARALDEAAVRRTELLQLRFGDGMPLRDIARRWGVDPARLYREHARAREEFREALDEVVASHHPGDPGAAEAERLELLAHFDVSGGKFPAIGGPGDGSEGASSCKTKGPDSPPTPPMP